MTRTYEISIESDQTTYKTVKRLASMAQAIAFVKEFADDWHTNAIFFVFCRENEQFAEGRAN